MNEFTTVINYECGTVGRATDFLYQRPSGVFEAGWRIRGAVSDPCPQPARHAIFRKRDLCMGFGRAGIAGRVV